jgi:tetratricopeptide (TPR) repeat protein
MTLLKSKNDKENTSNLFNDAINYCSKANANPNLLETYLKEGSDYYLSINNYQKASDLLEKLRLTKPKDFRILFRLISIYSKIDNEKAKE